MNDGRTLHTHRRTGQTLAEFAITLPILLLLLFGIIEFGRIFQAWVTLQNSARAAARYATTGVYDTDKYKLDLNIYDASVATWHGDLDSIVPCMKNEELNSDDPNVNTQRLNRNLAQRGVLATYDDGTFPSTHDIQVYVNGPKSIYATYYSGDDCDPTDEDDQNRRKDLARLLSIWDEARLGAAGLGLGSQVPPLPPIGVPGLVDNWPNWSISGTYPDPATMPWYQVWDRPLPDSTSYTRLRHSDEPGWFDVNVCSTRDTLDPENVGFGGEKGGSRFRFPTVLTGDPRAPVCLNSEIPNSTLSGEGWTTNTDVPWLDAGGPGDTVMIVVTFNHPLVTPLGLASFLPLQARRVAVNEAFRAPRAVPPSYDLPDPPTLLPTDDSTPTNTPIPPSPTDTPIPPSATDTLTPTATNTPEFTCSFVTVGNLTYTSNAIQFTITNNHPLPTTLTRVSFFWTAPTGYDSMATVNMSLGGVSIWSGHDNQPLLDVGNSVSVEPTYTPPPPGGLEEYPFSVSEESLAIMPGTTVWQVSFTNGPSSINSVNMPSTVFNGTTFYFDNLNTTTDCPVQLLSYPTSTPTDTLPPGVTPSSTPTADCPVGAMQVSAASFEQNDVVKFEVRNFYADPVTVTGFDIHWDQHGTYTNMRLTDVWSDGTGPGVNHLWMADPGQDAFPGTQSDSEGTWLYTASIAPGGTLPVYVVFGGGGINTLPVDFPGVTVLDFNGSTFMFDPALCPMTTVVAATPPPTPTPSNTPTNTFTPTDTSTYTPTNTATFTPTNAPVILEVDVQCNNTTGTPRFYITNTSIYDLGSLTFYYRTYDDGVRWGNNPRTRTNTLNAGQTISFTHGSSHYGTILFSLDDVTGEDPWFTLNVPPSLTATTDCYVASPTPSNTPTITPTASNTPTPTNTYTPSNTPTNTYTPTATFTASNTATFTPTFTPTATPTTVSFTITLNGSCTNYTGSPTFSLTSSISLPSGISFQYRLYDDTVKYYPSSNTYGNINSPFTGGTPKNFSNTGSNHFGEIMVTVSSVTGLPSWFNLTTSLPTSFTVTCVPPTNTPTWTATNTKTNTPTATSTFTPSNTPTFTPTPTHTPTYTPSNTFTPSNTPSATPTHTPTFTPSPTPTFTATATPVVLQLSVSGTCPKGTGAPTFTISNVGPAFPGGSTINFVLYHNSVQFDSGSKTSLPAAVPPPSITGRFGNITLSITSVSLPSGYVLSTSLPLDRTVTCLESDPGGSD